MKKRYTISHYDSIVNQNIHPASPEYVKRFVMYDHICNTIVSDPVIERSGDHVRMIEELVIINKVDRDEFWFYNNELKDWLRTPNHIIHRKMCNPSKYLWHTVAYVKVND